MNSTSPVRRWFAKPLSLWLAFIAIHAWLMWLGQHSPSRPLGDVEGIYVLWMQQLQHGAVVGVNSDWVYPIVALLPLMLASLAGLNNYVMTWLIMIALVNAAAFAVLLGSWSKPVLRYRAAWWWLLFLLTLGSIAVGRLDSVTTPLVMIALLVAVARPTIAGALIAAAAWIKVWPAALGVLLVAIFRGRPWVIIGALSVTAGVTLAALIAGAGQHILSFLSNQATRGLQIEAPISTPFMWLASAHAPGFVSGFDGAMLTFQVSGPGTDIVATASTIIQIVLLCAALPAGWMLVRRGHSAIALMPRLALLIVLILIVFNKVGSPQFVTWLAAPIVADLVINGKRAYPVALMGLLIAGLTQWLYPFAYDALLTLDPAAVLLLTIRNLCELGFFFFAGIKLLRYPRSSV